MTGRGHIRRRGEGSWELKFDAPGTTPGARVTRYRTVRGTKRVAQAALTAILAGIDTDQHVDPHKVTVEAFVRARVNQWESSGKISARTAQRYRQLCENQIVPHIGTKLLQRLQWLDIEEWHTTLRNSGRVRGRAGGVAARTIGHAHRVLGKALRDAVRGRLIQRNIISDQAAPTVPAQEMAIVRDVQAFVDKLAGRLRVPALVALFTGMRLGEILALRWSRADLGGKVIQVREALEHTKAHGIRLKPPKSAAGHRNVTIPDILVEALREHRKAALELRIQLGAGRLPDDALLFATVDGGLLSPNAMSAAWADFAASIGMPEITFHSLRHSHASMLIDKGVDIVTISTRLGHAKPDITLRVYARLFQKDDRKAAAAINASWS